MALLRALTIVTMLLAASVLPSRAERLVLAVTPVASDGFPASITAPVAAKWIELARDSGVFSVFDQADLNTVLRMQKQGASPVMSNPVDFGRLVAARKVLTSELRRAGEQCSLGIKITDVETGLVDAARLEVGNCALPALLASADSLWHASVAGRLAVTTKPAGLRVSVDGAEALTTPFERVLPVGQHRVRLVSPGYAAAATTVTLGYLERKSVSFAPERRGAGRLQLFGSPVSAPVYLGDERFGMLPIDQPATEGVYALVVETDAGRFPITVTVAAGKKARARVDAPFNALREFDAGFVAANHAAHAGDHKQAALLLDGALSAGLAAHARLPADARLELRAALLYVQGVRALEEAWLRRPHAQATGELAGYCEAIEEAAARFAEAAAALPAERRLGLAANRLVERRGQFDLGACAPSVRFSLRVAELHWPLAATAPALRRYAAANRALLGALKAQATLEDAQKRWLGGEEALLIAYDKWGVMMLAKDDLLRAPGESLPRFCKAQKEARQWARAARKRYEGVQDSRLPLGERLELIADLERRMDSQGSLCP